MIYQRLLLRPKDQPSDPHGNEPGESEAKWYQLQWYREPDAAVLFLLNEGKAPSQPIIAIDEPQPESLMQRLHRGLSLEGLKADACFACRNWQPSGALTEDSLPAGRCHWQDKNESLPDALATQSPFSLACAHFQRSDTPPPLANTTGDNVPRVRKSAELDPDRLPFWPRLWQRLRHHRKPKAHWADEIIERSGVGAGTEPCFVCQGRLANLGAIAVASPEGDKQTLSVWRCRSCYTTYFNDWTDRWERLENLETEEIYYRIAPAEAYAALQVIHSTEGGEHPAGREERHQQRAQLLALVQDTPPLSHQVRQGR